MTELLHKCMTKATTVEGDQMKFGPNWVTARRAILKVFPDRVECGDWIIPNERIEEATLYSIRTNFFIPGYVLRLTREEKAYHFGLNAGKYWKGELPFSVNREKGKLAYSKFSIAIRIALIAYICYYIWGRS
jgi:hypothetical protein